MQKYRVVRELGRGGMGIVCEAYEPGLDRKVALKRLLLEDADEDSKERHLREARALARLDHPNIVRVHGLEEHKGVAFLVMELVEGRTLAEVLAHRDQPPADAARLVLVLARAVQHAHDAGIVHRDLKPTNILLAPRRPEPEHNTPYGCPKVADFGLARDRRNQLQLTCHGVVAGTPLYMASEQARGDRKLVGPATDVYALGVILYEALTGQLPFQGGSELEVLNKVAEGKPRSPEELKSGLPAALTDICLRCLARNPEERYPSADMLADALARFLALPEPVPVARTRGRRWWVFGVLVVLALLVGGVWVWWWVSDSRVVGDDGEEPPVVPAVAAVPWNVDVKVLTASEDKQWTLISEVEALPVRAGDLIRVEVTSNKPAYVYVLLLTNQGDVVPLWPWNQDDAADAPNAPARKDRSPVVW